MTLTLTAIPGTDLAYMVSTWAETTEVLPSQDGAYETALDRAKREAHPKYVTVYDVYGRNKVTDETVVITVFIENREVACD